MTKERTKKEALNWIDSVIRQYESGIREIKQHRKQFIDAKPGQLGPPESVLGWIVNDINNVNMNMRLDMAVRLAYDLGEEK